MNFSSTNVKDFSRNILKKVSISAYLLISEFDLPECDILTCVFFTNTRAEKAD